MVGFDGQAFGFFFSTILFHNGKRVSYRRAATPEGSRMERVFW